MERAEAEQQAKNALTIVADAAATAKRARLENEQQEEEIERMHARALATAENGGRMPDQRVAPDEGSEGAA